MITDYKTYETSLVASYSKAAEAYRKDDEIEVKTENHQRICGNLGRITSSFGRKIRVLDAGCGTGRHFHCLNNVEELTAMDICPEMLEAAEIPVHRDRVSIGKIQLLRANIYEQSFSPGSFDFIYSLGVFGHGAQLTSDLCRKFLQWLRPGGRLYINTIETSTEPKVKAARKRIKKAIYPYLPESTRRALDERSARMPVFTTTCEQLQSIVSASGFEDFTISTNICRSSLWTGVHLECLANKAAGGAVRERRDERETAMMRTA